MVIQILGKQHKSGTSQKTGRPYDFTIIHFAGYNRFVEGQAALTVNIGADLLPYDKILVGLHYDIEPDLDGNIIKITPCKA